MVFYYNYFLLVWVSVYIFFKQTLSTVSCSATVIKSYASPVIRYIDFTRTPGLITQDLPLWVNNYNRELTNEAYEHLIQNTGIDYHTSGKCLYIWDSTAHLPFDYFTFFSTFFFCGGIFYSLLFFFLILLNLVFLWFVFLSFYQKDRWIFFNLFNKKSFIYSFFIWFILQYFVHVFDLITLYPEEWSFALIVILLIFFLDLFWGACLLDFKIIILDYDAYAFFYGLHFEFLTFIMSLIFFLTIGLDFLGLIEFLGQSEYWTKWD
jgi:hypothetical protein